jgi:hypothetical protein
VLFACIVATTCLMAQAQPVVESTTVGAEVAVQTLVVPEPTQPVEGPGSAGAATAGIGPAAASTTGTYVGSSSMSTLLLVPTADQCIGVQ